MELQIYEQTVTPHSFKTAVALNAICIAWADIQFIEVIGCSTSDKISE